MSRRYPIVALLIVLALSIACTNKKVNNPLANVGSKQPDKVLFDRAMDAMKHNKFDVARLTLQTLINTYPDSEFIARAKLAVADSWYAEGGSTALAQAEVEYKDFITFFPNMPEAAEAQLKIANIHYQQMEKPDRDYTHAARAEEEYRQLIMQFPDSKLLPEAKQRLLEVQEVLAEREFRVGRFYYIKESYPAAIARLRSVIDRYPLYSRADEALYLLGQSYEGEVELIRSKPTKEEARKARMIDDQLNRAAEAYSRIITRYPLMDRTEDAKARLEALHRTVPKPTRAAVAQNKAEEESRRETGMFGRALRNFQKHPDVAQATKVGDPSLVDPQPVSASDVVREATRVFNGVPAAGSKGVSVETIGNGAPPAGQEAPRSDTPPPAGGDVAAPATETPAVTAPDNSAAPAAAPTPDANELTPNVQNDPNELKPNVGAGQQTLPPPQQVNEIQNGAAPSADAAAPSPDGKTATSTTNSDDQETVDISTSKKKKKKGLRKIVPF